MRLEFPRFRGHLSAWSALSGRAGRIVRHAEGIELPEAVSAGVQAGAVELLRSTGRPLEQVARGLGVSTESLRLWRKRAEIDGGERQGLTSDERAELRQLRREVSVLRQEREILKKAAGFFAKESESR